MTSVTDGRLESVFEDKSLPGKELPRILEGEGFGIVEDCGGPDGLAHLAEVFKKKTGEEYKALSEWLGQKDLDLSAFDLNDMNFRLKKCLESIEIFMNMAMRQPTIPLEF